ncbi:MAG: hypothetical protein ABW202_14345 [Duganella sp.]
MEALLRVAQLRVQGKPDQALTQVAEELRTAAPGKRALLMLQGLYAAQEADDTGVAHGYAAELADLAPGLPSLQPYLAPQGAA